jgi:hypothetical protein
MAPMRYFSRFEKADGSQTVVWPTHRYEYDQKQPLLQADMPLVGESYSFDQVASRAPLKSNALETVRFLDVGDVDSVEADIDNFKRIIDWGIGKIVTTGSTGERWAWGRPVEMMSVQFTVDNVRHFPFAIGFIRSSDFYAAARDQLTDITTNPQVVIATNNGNAQAKDIIVIVKGPATHPIITNNSALIPGTSTPYKLESTTALAAGTDWLRFNARTNKVEKSTNSGVTWVDDSANYVIQSGQLRLMVFEPGANSLSVAAVTGDIEVLWTDTWH